MTTQNNIDPRVRSRASGIIRRYRFAERGEVENRLLHALIDAQGAYDPSRGMTREQYEALGLNNRMSHIRRSLAAEERRRRVTDSFEKPAGDDLRLEDVLCDHRDGERRLRQTIALREYVGTLTGTTWSVVVAVLAGYRFSEVARHLGIARTTFDRVYGAAIRKIREVIG